MNNIFIDFDGVVCNSNFLKEKNISKAYKKVMGYINVEFIHYFTKHNGIPREIKLKKFVNDKDLEEKILIEYHNLNSSINELKLAPGLLDYLINNKKKNIYILSGGDKSEIERYLKKNCIYKYFKRILCGPLTKNENLTNIKINVTDIFIGDSKHDFEVAKKNNLKFIFMTQYTQEKYPYDFLSNQTLIINNFKQI